MNLKHLSNRELLNSTKTAVTDERTSTSRVLHHLREVEARSLHLELGYSSMFAYCRGELGYDEDQTNRRLAAMRLLRELPEIETKIASGELSLTNLNQAKTTFNKMAKKQGSRLKASQKLEILKTLENKSIRECQRELIKVCPEQVPLKLETQRPLSEELAELKLIIPQKTLANMERLKELLSHRGPLSTVDLIIELVKEKLSKIDPLRSKAVRSHPAESVNPKAIALLNSQPAAQLEHKPADLINLNSAQPVKPIAFAPHHASGQGTAIAANKLAPSSKTASSQSDQASSPKSRKLKSRYIPAQVRREVWRRDKGRCAFVSSETKKRCDSSFRLQIEHLVPFAIGGGHGLENLQLLCQAHNGHRAVRFFGKEKMARYLSRMKP